MICMFALPSVWVKQSFHSVGGIPRLGIQYFAVAGTTSCRVPLLVLPLQLAYSLPVGLVMGSEDSCSRVPRESVERL